MSVVIDAAALLCVLPDERGADVVLPVLRGAHISAVNVSESCSRGVERGSTVELILEAVRAFELRVHPFDLALARSAAELRPVTQKIGASLGDRACLALGLQLSMPIFTADRRLGMVDAGIGVDVRLIR